MGFEFRVLSRFGDDSFQRRRCSGPGEEEEEGNDRG